jgi:hypothetical protein
MKVRLLTLALAVLFLTTFSSSLAQEGRDNPLEPAPEASAIFIGPVFGFNNSLHTVNLASFADEINKPLCPFFEGGSASGFYAGLSIEFFLGNVVNSQHSIIGRVLYSTLPVTMERDGDVYPSLVGEGDNQQIVNSSTRHDIEVDYNLISAEVMYNYKVIPRFGLGLTGGLTFDIPMTKTIYQTYNLIQPLNFKFRRVEGEGYTYINNDRTIVVRDGDIDDASGFRLGLKFGVQYDIHFAGGFYVVPAAYYNFGITDLTSAEDWRVDAIQIGVDIRFGI